ncbi:hypothetical protein JCM10212_000522 [Sporobolomyces blumeae]
MDVAFDLAAPARPSAPNPARRRRVAEPPSSSTTTTTTKPNRPTPLDASLLPIFPPSIPQPFSIASSALSSHLPQPASTSSTTTTTTTNGSNGVKLALHAPVPIRPKPRVPFQPLDLNVDSPRPLRRRDSIDDPGTSLCFEPGSTTCSGASPSGSTEQTTTTTATKRSMGGSSRKKSTTPLASTQTTTNGPRGGGAGGGNSTRASSTASSSVPPGEGGPSTTAFGSGSTSSSHPQQQPPPPPVYLAPDYLLNPAGPASSTSTDFKCPNCDKVYKGKHARSIWRRHLQDKHGIPLSQQPRRTRWDNDANRPKSEEERRARTLDSKRKWARKNRAEKDSVPPPSTATGTPGPSGSGVEGGPSASTSAARTTKAKGKGKRRTVKREQEEDDDDDLYDPRGSATAASRRGEEDEDDEDDRSYYARTSTSRGRGGGGGGGQGSGWSDEYGAGPTFDPGAGVGPGDEGEEEGDSSFASIEGAHVVHPSGHVVAGVAGRYGIAAGGGGPSTSGSNPFLPQMHHLAYHPSYGGHPGSTVYGSGPASPAGMYGFGGPSPNGASSARLHGRPYASIQGPTPPPPGTSLGVEYVVDEHGYTHHSNPYAQPGGRVLPGGGAATATGHLHPSYLAPHSLNAVASHPIQHSLSNGSATSSTTISSSTTGDEYQAPLLAHPNLPHAYAYPLASHPPHYATHASPYSTHSHGSTSAPTALVAGDRRSRTRTLSNSNASAAAPAIMTNPYDHPGTIPLESTGGGGLESPSSSLGRGAAGVRSGPPPTVTAGQPAPVAMSYYARVRRPSFASTDPSASSSSASAAAAAAARTGPGSHSSVGRSPRIGDGIAGGRGTRLGTGLGMGPTGGELKSPVKLNRSLPGFDPSSSTLGDPKAQHKTSRSSTSSSRVTRAVRGNVGLVHGTAEPEGGGAGAGPANKQKKDDAAGLLLALKAGPSSPMPLNAVVGAGVGGSVTGSGSTAAGGGGGGSNVLLGVQSPVSAVRGASSHEDDDEDDEEESDDRASSHSMVMWSSTMMNGAATGSHPAAYQHASSSRTLLRSPVHVRRFASVQPPPSVSPRKRNRSESPGLLLDDEADRSPTAIGGGGGSGSGSSGTGTALSAAHVLLTAKKGNAARMMGHGGPGGPAAGGGAIQPLGWNVATPTPGFGLLGALESSPAVRLGAAGRGAGERGHGESEGEDEDEMDDEDDAHDGATRRRKLVNASSPSQVRRSYLSSSSSIRSGGGGGGNNGPRLSSSSSGSSSTTRPLHHHHPVGLTSELDDLGFGSSSAKEYHHHDPLREADSEMVPPPAPSSLSSSSGARPSQNHLSTPSQNPAVPNTSSSSTSSVASTIQYSNRLSTSGISALAAQAIQQQQRDQDGRKPVEKPRPSTEDGSARSQDPFLHDAPSSTSGPVPKPFSSSSLPLSSSSTSLPDVSSPPGLPNSYFFSSPAHPQFSRTLGLAAAPGPGAMYTGGGETPARGTDDGNGTTIGRGSGPGDAAARRKSRDREESRESATSTGTVTTSTSSSTTTTNARDEHGASTTASQGPGRRWEGLETTTPVTNRRAAGERGRAVASDTARSSPVAMGDTDADGLLRSEGDVELYGEGEDDDEDEVDERDAPGLLESSDREGEEEDDEEEDEDDDEGRLEE